MALRDGMNNYGKSSAFYSKTACCLIDNTSVWMSIGVPGGTHAVPGWTYAIMVCMISCSTGHRIRFKGLAYSITTWEEHQYVRSTITYLKYMLISWNILFYSHLERFQFLWRSFYLSYLLTAWIYDHFQ